MEHALEESPDIMGRRAFVAAQAPNAWRPCIHPTGEAVCEAYRDEEWGADGAEIFREEGSEGPQGPDVPEGAVAGVIVLQPDGSPCIGWLLAHPAIVRSSSSGL